MKILLTKTTTQMKNLTIILTEVKYLKTAVATPVLSMTTTIIGTMETTPEKTRKYIYHYFSSRIPVLQNFFWVQIFFFFILDSVELFL